MKRKYLPVPPRVRRDGGDKYPLTVTLFATQIVAIDELANKTDGSRSYIVRKLVAEALAAREKEEGHGPA